MGLASGTNILAGAYCVTYSIASRCGKLDASFL